MMGRMLAMISGKGGVGKSTLAAALGTHWAAGGHRVVLVDLSFGMRCLDMHFGLESRIAFDLNDIVEGSCGLDKAILRDRDTGVQLIAPRQFDEGKPLNERTLRIILEVLCLQNDYVLLDAPSGMGYGFEVAARLAEELVLVTTPDDVSLRDAERVAALLGREKRTWLVVNRIWETLVDEGLQYEPATCAQVLDVPLLGAIPEDEQVLRHMLRKTPIIGDYPAARAIANIADRLEDGDVPIAQWRTAPPRQQPERRPQPTWQTETKRPRRSWLRR